MERQTGIPTGQPYSTVLISPPIIRLSSLSRSFSHSLTGSVPEAVLKNLAGRIFSESFIHMLYHIWYNMSSSMLHKKSMPEEKKEVQYSLIRTVQRKDTHRWQLT